MIFIILYLLVCCSLNIKYNIFEICTNWIDYHSKSFIIPGCISPKRVTSLQSPPPRHCARATQLLSKKCCSNGYAVPNLIGPRFEPQTSRFRDERVTARLTGWYELIVLYINRFSNGELQMGLWIFIGIGQTTQMDSATTHMNSGWVSYECLLSLLCHSISTYYL